MRPPKFRNPDPRLRMPGGQQCGVPQSQREQRTLCPCGGANTIRLVVEYVSNEGDSRVEYAGGRFCYRADAHIDIELPADAIPTRALIYDLHQPDEIITITFTQKERRVDPKDSGSPESPPRQETWHQEAWRQTTHRNPLTEQAAGGSSQHRS